MKRTLLSLLVATLISSSMANGEELTTRTVGAIKVKDGHLVDEYGLEWLLNGVNARIEGIFDVSFDDGRKPLHPVPAFDQWDAYAMVREGFNFLRLAINWSGLEPKEGEFSEAYLERIDRVLKLCEEAGLYVLIDFHQDAWSKEIGEDGAPLWAIIPPPEELLEGPLEDLNRRRTTKQAIGASISFFLNKEGIQDRFMPAWRIVASRYANVDHVIGFEPMNEPVALLVPNGQERLLKFYERVATELRQAGATQPIWLEPETMRNQFLKSPLLSEPFPDSNVVYEPHLYPPGLGGLDYEGLVNHLTATFDSMVKEGESWGGPVVIGEWGRDPTHNGADEYFDAIFHLADERLIGLTYWVWKEHCMGHTGFFDYSEEEGWTPRTEGVKRFTRPRALAVPGELTSHHFDPKTAVLKVTFVSQGGEASPLFHIPAHRYLNGFELTTNGTEAEVKPDEESRRCLIPWTGKAGKYEVMIRPK